MFIAVYVMAKRAWKRLLIANRGEIAVRIIRACQELGLETVQVYSEADRDSLPVRLADRAVCIGPAHATRSYLHAPFVISAALTSGADAIHPGYGFLAENAPFARLCAQAGLVFVGPDPETIATMGDKVQARRMAWDLGIPTIPGSVKVVADVGEAREVAEKIGYPILLKAAAGGGGRGMRLVGSAEDMAEHYAGAAREAAAAFGNAALYVERYLAHSRHVEIQVLADGATVLHCGERECSVQRRHQKLLEESPAPALREAVRARMAEAAVRLCQRVGYRSVGTVECLVEPESEQFYFMEMNTRLQVEHPVTECVTGLDLVKAQIRLAQGEPLAWCQSDIRLQGHAVECRITAEDPDAGFTPCPGRVTHVHWPGGPGLRVDSHLYTGYHVPPYYDALLAKIIAWGQDRQEALARMRRALDEMRVERIQTTLPLHQKLLRHPQFCAGAIHTRFVEDVLLETT